VAEKRGVLDRFLTWANGGEVSRSWPTFTFDGNRYPYGFGPSSISAKQEPPDASFAGYAAMLYRANPILFACAMLRLSLFSEARFQFRRIRSGRPGDLFGTPALRVLETPWPNGTTRDLLARAIQDADIAGNAFFTLRGGFLRRMRPDWVAIVLGSESEEWDAEDELDATVAGYVYKPGGISATSEAVVLLPEQVCHFAPIPDPTARYRGMSWLESIVQELMADSAATEFKLKYFEQGATANVVVNVEDPNIQTEEQFKNWTQTFRRLHEGTDNAFKTMFFTAATKVSTIGSNLDQAAFKVVQGAGETRIAAAARTPAVLVGISEGLQGSSLNAGNYDEAGRQFGDLTMRPLWGGFAGAIAPLVDVPSDAEIWYDDRDIPFLQQDVKDAAEIQATQARTIRELLDAGYQADSVIAAVNAGDWSLLEHSGLFSVQLQPPGTVAPEPSSNGAAALPIGDAI
jgi:hypothetical protein